MHSQALPDQAHLAIRTMMKSATFGPQTAGKGHLRIHTVLVLRVAEAVYECAFSDV